MKILIHLAIISLFLLLPAAAAADAPLNEFTGKIVKVVPAEHEIYVFADGQKNEYYLNNDTKIIEDGLPALFSRLIVGEKVKVTARKIGKRLDPVTVEIVKE